MDSHIIDCLIHPQNIPFTTSRPLNHWEGTKPQAKDSLMVYPTYLFSYSSMVPLNFLAMCSHAFFFVFFFVLITLLLGVIQTRLFSHFIHEYTSIN